MKLSLRQAAQQAGVSKSTILRAIQKGRLSAERNDDGGYSIDPAEVQRVYDKGQAGQVRTTSQGQDATGVAQQGAPDETPALKAEIEGLKAQLALMKDQVTDLKDQRDGWQKQAEAHQRLLQDMRPEPRRWFSFGKAS